MKTLLTCLMCCLIFFGCVNKQQHATDHVHASSQPDSLPLVQITQLDQLPDSLSPHIVFVDSAPKPLVVNLPDHAGGFYQRFNAAGISERLPLEPPTRNMLPVLKNHDGLANVSDSLGNSYVLGEGGTSNFAHFTTEDGLAQDAIACSFMDSRGHLWFGTYGGGVSKYDGKSFVTITTAHGLANNNVWCITEDQTGTLWFGTNGGGVSKYDGKTCTNFTTDQGLPNNSIWSIMEDQSGKLWLGSNGGGVSVYDGKQFKTFTTSDGLVNNIVTSIVQDKKGMIWFGTLGGVGRYDGKSFDGFSIADGLPSNLVLTALCDRSGDLWFGTSGGGLSRFDGNYFITLTQQNGLGNNNIRCLSEDHLGNIWIGTTGGGVSKFSKSENGNRQFVTYTTTEGLSNNTVWSITEDRGGNLWFGTYGGGVNKYEGTAFTSFSMKQGLANNSIWSIQEDQQRNLWFGTYGGGVSKYDGVSFTNYHLAQGLAHKSVLSMALDHSGNIWMGTDGEGVCKFDGKSFTTYTTRQGLASNSVWSIAEDHKGQMWFGTFGGGVSCFDGKQFRTYTKSQGLAGNVIRCITEDHNRHLWFGTDDGGITRFDGRTMMTLKQVHGLAGNNVSSILRDRHDNLWFGTEGGGISRLSKQKIADLTKLLKIQSQNESNLKYTKDDSAPTLSILPGFEQFDMALGLANNVVYDIIEDKHGNIIIGTNLGFTLIPASKSTASFETIKLSLVYYNTPNGYPIKDVNANAMYADSEGRIWAGTGSEKTALVRLDPASLLKPVEKPEVVIQSIKVNEENVAWYALLKATKSENHHQGNVSDTANQMASRFEELLVFGNALTQADRQRMKKRFGDIEFSSIRPFYPLPENLILPYHHNHLTFEFACIETGKPGLVNYRYMLEGYDKNWSPVLRKTSATFGHMNEGSYTFKLKAQPAGGEWSQPIEYTFKVLPPWYRTWWAYLLYVLSFLILLRAFNNWRERNLRREKEKLERMVKKRTIELEKKNVLVEKQKAEVQRQKEVVEDQKSIIEQEKLRSDELLLNILPEEVAEELKATGTAAAKQFKQVTVMFTDFKNFTQITEKLSPAELVEEIHMCFKAFDEIITKYNLEKIKTIGDGYMCAGGLPIQNDTHPEDVIRAALEIQAFMHAHTKSSHLSKFDGVRIGIHTGPVVAGIVGVKKFAYDIWGDTVNIASRMESSSEAGKVNISGSTYELVQSKFACTHRGKIQAKNKGQIEMYFVDQELSL